MIYSLLRKPVFKRYKVSLQHLHIFQYTQKTCQILGTSALNYAKFCFQKPRLSPAKDHSTNSVVSEGKGIEGTSGFQLCQCTSQFMTGVQSEWSVNIGQIGENSYINRLIMPLCLGQLRGNSIMQIFPLLEQYLRYSSRLAKFRNLQQ